jgi:hypothetical protein
MNRRGRLAPADALRTTPAGELASRRAQLQAAAEADGMGPQDIREVLDSRPDLPRPLLVEERATLMAVLTHADFDGRDGLLVQAETAQVVGHCGCGCATVHLQVDRETAPALRTASPLPNQPWVLDASGKEIGGVIVFLEDGYLSLLEVYAFDQPISPFPPIGRLDFPDGDSA